MAADNRTIKELSTSGLANAAPLCIQYPGAAPEKTDEFELKSSLLHHIPKYHGLSMEDPNKHLKEFEVVCSSMTPINVDGSLLKMKAFPFSLMQKAKDWLYELTPGTVTSLESMKRAFLEKFFPTSRVILLRKRINGIQQEEGCGRAKSSKCKCVWRMFPARTPYGQVPTIDWERRVGDLNAVGFGQQYQQRSDPFSNTYNPGWRDHPNFKWREPQQGQQQSAFRQQPPGFYQKPFASTQPQAQPTQTNSGSSIDNDQIFQLLTSMAQGMQNRDKRMDELEKQVRQIAEFMGQFREQGKFPSSTVVNPRGGVETAKAITLRSGKEVGTEPQPSKSTPKEDEKFQIEEEDQAKATARIEQSLPQPPKHSNSATIGKEGPIQVNSNVIPPNVPFPSRFLQAKNEEKEKDVLETFRKVHVNIPLLDAIKQIPKYAKFFKKRKLPPKCKDPGSFTIPCVIGNTRFDHAMLDLGTFINVMPYSVYASMNLGKLKNDGVIIQLADRSNAYPKGVLEDVLVQVEHLVFPADFYVLEMDESDHALSLPILLGKPFMKTAQTKIDVAKGLVTMTFGGDMISFKISESIETPNIVHSCCAIDKFEKIGPDRSAPSTKDASRTMQDEGIGVEYKAHTATAFNVLKVAMGKNVHIAATSSHHIGKPPNPNPIPIKVDRWFPSLVQVPKQTPDGGRMNMNFRQHNAPINKHHYPFPFKDAMYKNFVGQVVEEIPLHAVGSNGA
ncbi:unnamed protein product [Malus baccata var. baccata]